MISRINNDFRKAYRALGVRREETIVWFWIGKHSDYEKLIGQC